MRLRPGIPEEAGISEQRMRHVATSAEGWVRRGITSAVVALAARRGVIVLHEAFGRMAPEEDAPPVPADAIFPLASITKPITATAAMILVEEGLLGLNRPVVEYLPEFTGEGKQAVMVHHLLTHTSGLRNEDVEAHAAGKKASVAIPPAEETQHPVIHEYLSLRYDAPLWKAPGTEMSYSKCGYVLLGEIIRRITGTSLDRLARERILDPLGMRDTHYIVPESVSHRVVRGPADGPTAGWYTRAAQEEPWAAGGALSTAMDIAVFGQMFLNRGFYGDARILSPASVGAMTCNQIPGIGARYGEEFFPEASWGLGWSIRGNKKSPAYGEPLLSSRAFTHGGAGGVSLWVDPTYEVIAVLFSVSPREMLADLFINRILAAIVDVH